ncbi:MAG: hypothetical protein KFB96_04675 [Thiocapsa sp.]|uniref:hypothetical protein n=1 Tax=Thiocapsa sp. TaxID=2024551 RepID=UPI001BCBEBC6|nr:hypothetical protein [Thiocapsa sp.]QVL49791.1 MAG: hypothetical protein KFB96_04675 [Thiocapsa sp.]
MPLALCATCHDGTGVTRKALAENLSAPVAEVDILNPYNARETLDDKLTIVDVKAHDTARPAATPSSTQNARRAPGPPTSVCARQTRCGFRKCRVRGMPRRLKSAVPERTALRADANSERLPAGSFG